MNRKILFLIIGIFLLIPSLSLFHSGLPLTHDGQDQVARIANFYINLQDGNIIPRWAPNLNWGYGHPILEFLYPLPSYIASFFHFLGFSFIDSAKVVFALGIILSLVFMYLWLSSLLGELPSLLGAVLYTYAPYRFVDLYVRGDIGENLAFAFMPLVLYFIYKIYKTGSYKFVVLAGISLAFLILAHNAIALMFIPFIIFYSLYLIYLSNNRKFLIINLSSFMVLGFGLSAFFWIPGLLEARYTLRNIVTAGEYAKRFVSLEDLIYGSWSYGGTGQFTVQLGIVQWIFLIISPFIFFFHKKRNKIFIAGLILYTLVAIFIMLPMSSFIWNKVMILQNFQFPWRFLAITIFSTAVLSSFILDLIPNRYKTVLLAISFLVILFLSRNYWYADGYFSKPDSFFTNVYNGTTDTGESAPVWSVRFMLKRPKAPMQVISGEAQISKLKRTSTLHIYTINVLKNSRMVENTLYFPGWKVLVNGSSVPLQFQDPKYRGLMTFILSPGHYKVQVEYTETKLRLISDLLSVVSIVVIIGILGFGFVKKKGS